MSIASNEVRKLNRRTESTDAYIDSIFNIYSKVLAIRVDFYYNLNHPANSYLSEEMAKSHMADYLNNYRSYQNLGSLTVGHQVRLERAEHRGLHFHCLFFLNGQTVKNYDYYAHLLGEYWCRTLRNAAQRGGYVLNEYEMLGHYNVCDPNDYANSGIGRIDYHNTAKIQILKDQVAGYLLKPYSNVSGGYWKGQAKKVNAAIGRPRMYL